MLLDAFYPETDELSEIFLVTDFVDYTMQSFLENYDNTLGESQAIILCYNMLLSLRFLHTANVLHRDIKPANILIDKYCSVKFCDFGLSRTLSYSDKDCKPTKHKLRSMSPRCYTRYYRPPEVILCNQNYDQQADIWSVGCIISEIAMFRLNQQNGFTAEINDIHLF